jgi:hypothetical protein
LIVSVIYLGRQIRDNTRLLRSQAHYNAPMDWERCLNYYFIFSAGSAANNLVLNNGWQETLNPVPTADRRGEESLFGEQAARTECKPRPSSPESGTTALCSYRDRPESAEAV